MSSGRLEAHSEGAVLVLCIDHAPVNALNQTLRAALLAHVIKADDDPHTRAIVIHGQGKHFVAGADIREFDSPPRAPLLNDVLLRLEASKKPVVAALHGAVLGGGLELALACHYRCATSDVALGFPEVNLGLLPGSGGTQRLPRVVGAAVALHVMLGGEPIGIDRAQELGLIDRALTGTDAKVDAINYANELIRDEIGPRRLCDRRVDGSDLTQDWWIEARLQAAKVKPGLLAPAYIVDCVEDSLTLPFHTALRLARNRFEECRTSQASRSLRHLFLAERSSRGAQGMAVAQPVKQVAVVGAGTMGAGIAISLAINGLEVTLIDTQPASLTAGLIRLSTTIEASAKKGRLTKPAATAAIARVRGDTAMAGAAQADLVIEAIVENLAAKQSLFRELDSLCRPGAVLATNTSTLDVDAIATATSRPQAVVGMHFFSPANVMRLVEIVRGSASSALSVATALGVTRRMGKLGVVVGNSFGFVGNRMLYAYGRENQLMMLEGARPMDVDTALKQFGMAMGPNAVGDLAGLDVGYRARRERKDPPTDLRYYRVADVLVEAGRLGQKVGRGAFRYEVGSREPLADPDVDALIEVEAMRLGIQRRTLDAEEIVERCLYALINEGARLLGESIAASAADIDVIWCNGYGFPRLRGGPMFYADTLGLRVVLYGILRYGAKLGEEDWLPAPLLQDLVRRDESFADWDRRRADSYPAPGAA